MKKDWTVYTWKLDKRTKKGERLINARVVTGRDQTEMEHEVKVLLSVLSPSNKFRVEFVPHMKTVVNLMTGKEIEIPHDTPRACDPSSELFWSM